MSSQLKHDKQINVDSLIEHMNHGVAYCEMQYLNNRPVDFTYHLVNPAFEKITGLRNVVGKKVSEVIPGFQDSKIEIMELYGRVASTKISEQFESYIPELNMWLSISVYSPEAGFFVATFEDITDRKILSDKLVIALAEVEDLYESAPCGYHSIDKDGTIVRMNATELAWLGLKKEEVIGKLTFADIFTPKTRELFLIDFPKLMKDGLVYHREVELISKDRSIKNILLSASAVYDAERNFLMSHEVLYDVTERYRTEKAFRENNEKLHALYKVSPLGVVLSDLDGNFIEFNDSFQQFCGYSADELKALSSFQITPEKYHSDLHSEQQSLCQTGRYGPIEREYIRKDGSLIPLRISGVLINGADGKRYTWCIIEDITESKKALQALRENEEKLRGLYELSPLGIALTDMEGRYIEFNESFRRICGYPETELRNLDYWILTPKKYEEAEAKQLELLKTTGRYGPYEKEYLQKNGTLIPICLNGLIVHGRDGQRYIWSIVEDISQRRLAEEKIHRLAFYDPLTNLINRRLLDDRLEVSMATSDRSGRHCALLFLDLDNFKPLNDLHGHNVGDLLLQEVARRISSCVRKADSVARFGGDEFVVLLSELNQDRTESELLANSIAEKIRSTLAQPYVLRHSRKDDADKIIGHKCTSSIGGVIYISYEYSSDEVIKLADLAMYQAKNAGRDTLNFYDTNSKLRKEQN